MRRCLAAGAVWLTCMARSAVASAEEPFVLLELERCDELEETEVRRIVAAELGARPANSGGPGVTEVTVSCDGARVVIRVRDPLSRKALERSFDLGLSDPRGRERLVSIATTELVLASWTELDTNAHPHVDPAGPKPPEDVVKGARDIARDRMFHYEPAERSWYQLETPRDRMLRITALASMRTFFGYPGSLWGGGLRIGEERFRFLSWHADALFERGTVHTSDAAYDVVTTTIGGALFLYAHTGALTARVGAGLRAGLAGTSPQGAQTGGSSSVAPWGWPLGALSRSVRAVNMVFDLSGEAGYVVLPVEGASQKDIRGGWFSVQFGIGFVIPVSRRTEPEPEPLEEAAAE